MVCSRESFCCLRGHLSKINAILGVEVSKKVVHKVKIIPESFLSGTHLLGNLVQCWEDGGGGGCGLIEVEVE